MTANLENLHHYEVANEITEQLSPDGLAYWNGFLHLGEDHCAWIEIARKQGIEAAVALIERDAAVEVEE